ncbi:hypothetical protein HYZ70_01750 [Candidatus Curtissbacteria bacterium]|nr:hypothetical protein [Candidatus Curtissbacteria bacterium]
MVDKEALRMTAEEIRFSGRSTAVETARILSTVVENLTEEEIRMTVLLRRIRDSRLDDNSLYGGQIAMDTIFRALELTEGGLDLDEIYFIVSTDLKKDFGHKISLTSVVDLIWKMIRTGDIILNDKRKIELVR